MSLLSEVKFDIAIFVKVQRLIVIAWLLFHYAIKAKPCLIKQLLYYSGPGLIQKTYLAPRLDRAFIVGLVVTIDLLATFLHGIEQHTIFLGSRALFITHGEK